MRRPVAAIFFVFTSSTAFAQLGVTTLSPSMNASNVAPNAAIVVDFDKPVDAASLPPAAPHFHVGGSVTGPIAGTLALENADQRLRFTPAAPFQAGEIVTVELDHFVEAQDATFDDAERRRLFAEVQKVAGENVPMLYFAAPRLYAAHSTRVQGSVPSVIRPNLLWNVDMLSVK